jgi:hypothetical protein
MANTRAWRLRVDAIERRLGGGLFRRALGATRAPAPGVTREPDLDHEALLVVLDPAVRHTRVAGRRAARLVRPLLEARLRIRREGCSSRHEQIDEEAARERHDRVDARVEVDRRHERLEHVGEDAILVGAAGLALGATEACVRADAELARRPRQRARVDDRRPRAREVAFAPRRMGLVEQPRDSEVEHRVAEEFEPLVAAAPIDLVRIRGMRQRGREQCRIGEAMPERGLDRGARLVGARLAHVAAASIQPPPSTRSPA